jgi:hypothetical protein
MGISSQFVAFQHLLFGMFIGEQFFLNSFLFELLLFSLEGNILRKLYIIAHR